MTDNETHLVHALATVEGIASKNASDMTQLLSVALSALSKGRIDVVRERLEVVIDQLKGMTKDVGEVVDGACERWR